MNYILIGMRCSGKSTLGKLLAQRLNYKFYDLDDLIVDKVGLSINEIFQKFGENKFRQIENEVLLEFNSSKSYVLSLGGGTVISQSNQNIITSLGTVIYLKTNVEILQSRLNFQFNNNSNDIRPNLTLLPMKDELSFLYEQRKEVYEKLADIIFDNDQSLDEAIKNLYNSLIH